jgi:signal transduction histidine kinase
LRPFAADTSPSLSQLSGASLRWATGLFCAFIGAFMLIAPHQFSGPPHEPLAGWRTPWALVALATGVALLSVAATRTGRRQRLATHGLAAATLLALAAVGAANGSLNGFLAYTLLGAGMLTRSSLRGQRADGHGGDLLALLMGTMATLDGLFLLLLPRHMITGPVAGDRISHLPLIGLALLLTGPPLCWVQVHPQPRGRTWAAHLAGGLALIAYGGVRESLHPSWTMLALYWGMGGTVALLPAIRTWSAGFDSSSLRTRLAMTLGITTSVALIIAVAVSSAQEETLAVEQARETLDIEARSVAQDVRDYVELNSARAAAIAALASRLPPVAETQHRLLAASRPSFAGITGVLLLGLDGRLIAADGSASLGEATLRATVAAALASAAAPVQLALDRLTGRQLLLVATRVPGQDGQAVAAVVMAFDSQALDKRIARPGTIVTVADGSGHLIAHHGDLADSARWLPPNWDTGVLQGNAAPLPGNFAGFAVVPDLRWAVAIARPRAASLAGVDRGRELAFALLLLVVPLAVLGGILVAGRIIHPLENLADAVGELTAGNPWAPLGRSDFSEVERLSAAFREMRDRLAARTAESVRLEGELRARAEALAESDRRKDEFLAMLAHELRNPLGAISTASYILSQQSQPAPPGRAGAAEPRALRSLATIQRQTQHLARLVDDLLDVSRITRGKVELHREALDLADVVNHAVETTLEIVEARHHRLAVSTSPEPLPVLADPTRLEQVLANLIRNAAKFTEPGGIIAVEATAEDGEAVVRVRDSGMGIPGDLLPRIFDLFTQGHQGLDRAAGGLGIGLTLVRNLIEMHGGRVRAASAGPGRGSEFTIRLPLLKTAAAAGATASSAAPTPAAAGAEFRRRR